MKDARKTLTAVGLVLVLAVTAMAAACAAEPEDAGAEVASAAQQGDLLFPERTVRGEDTWVSPVFTATPDYGDEIGFRYQNDTSRTVTIYLYRTDLGAYTVVGQMTIRGEGQDRAVYRARDAGSGTYQLLVDTIGGGAVSGRIAAGQTDAPAAEDALYPARSISETAEWRSNPFGAARGCGDSIRFRYENQTDERVIVYLHRTDSGRDVLVGQMSVEGNAQEARVYDAGDADAGTYYLKISAIASGGPIRGDISAAQEGARRDMSSAVLFPEQTIEGLNSWRSESFTATAGRGDTIRFTYEDQTDERVIVYLYRTDSGRDEMVEQLSVEGNAQGERVYRAADADRGTYHLRISAIASGGPIRGSISAVQEMDGGKER